ncbi:MAG: hypothetical protein Q4C61_03860 [Lachnospiraceae bacterium]|nr:hypothetical protein [Lachnospiraceae bacterium]
MKNDEVWKKADLSKEAASVPGSGYLIAREVQAEECQKDLLYELLGPVFFGWKEAENEAELAVFFSQQYGIDVHGDFCEGDEHYEEYLEAQQAIAEGLAVYGGRITFDENSLAELAEKVWSSMEGIKKGGFRRINTLLEE